MANIREVFPVLEDSNNEGVALRAMQEGDTPASKNGLIGFSFKDASGNVVLPTLNGDGTIAVSSGAPGTALLNRGSNTGSLSAVTVASLTLTASTGYAEMQYSVSCRRSCLFQVIWTNDATDNILCEVLVDAGQYSFKADLGDYTFTAGATGTQTLKIVGLNLEKASNMYATIQATELA